MNEKGFTLIEMLAIVVILGVVFAIATTSVGSSIEKSKIKSESIFVGQISKAIDMYINLHGSDFTYTNSSKTYINDKGQTKNYKEYTFSIQNLFDEKLLDDDIVNPRTKTKCSHSGKNIKVYRDEKYVYNYETDLSGYCDILNENANISTFS